MTLHVFDILAQAFAQEKTEACFALMGDANMAFATRLSEQNCRMIYVRHEHCAVAAAMAYARKTGKTGVATVTCGPGLTQLMTALPAAVRAHIPLVILAGEAPLKTGWYNQAIDQAPFVLATGAAYHSLHWPGRMPTAIRDAFLQARTEKRPVVLGVPFDLQELAWEGDVSLPASAYEIMPDPAAVPPNADALNERQTPSTVPDASSSWQGLARRPLGQLARAGLWRNAATPCWQQLCQPAACSMMIRLTSM